MADIVKIVLPSGETYYFKDASAIRQIIANSPLTISGTTIGHADSGVTAASKGDTTAQTPTWGGTFKALSGTVNSTGHLTELDEHSVTIPNSTATSSANGLMASGDKAKLDAMTQTRIQNGILEYYDGTNWVEHNIAAQPVTALSDPDVVWEQGAISSSNGANPSTTSTTRIRTASYIPTYIVGLGVNTGYQYTLAAYNNGTYEGMWNGSSFVKSATWLTTDVDLTQMPGYRFRIVLANTSSSSISTSNSSNMIFRTTTNLSNMGTRIFNLEQALLAFNPTDPQTELYNLALRVATLESCALLGDPMSSSAYAEMVAQFTYSETTNASGGTEITIGESS